MDPARVEVFENLHATTKSSNAAAASEPQASAELAAPERPAELRVALAQIAPALGDRPRNIETHLAQIEAARQQAADLVVFPELSLTGYFLRDMVPEVALARTSLEIAQLIEAASPMSIVAGFVEEAGGHQFYNASFFGEAGRLLHVHRKVYLPTYGLFEEQRYFSPGKRFQAFRLAAAGAGGRADLRRFLARLGGHGDAGRRGRRADRGDQLACPRRFGAEDRHGRNV